MDNFVPMAVLHSAYHLLKKSPGLGLLEPAILDDIIKKLAACEFEHHDNLGLRLYYRVPVGLSPLAWGVNWRHRRRHGGRPRHVQLNNVGMSQQLEIFNLSLDPTSHVTADELLPGDDLERDMLPRAVVDGQLDLAKR